MRAWTSKDEGVMSSEEGCCSGLLARGSETSVGACWQLSSNQHVRLVMMAWRGALADLQWKGGAAEVR